MCFFPKFVPRLFCEGFLRPLFRRNLLMVSILQRSFWCTFLQVLFPWVFLRGHSFLFRGSVLPCRLSQRRCPWAHPRELFPCASLQWLFASALSRAFFRALLCKGFFRVFSCTSFCVPSFGRLFRHAFSPRFSLWTLSLQYIA